jgi:hypothetical protein
LLQTTSASDVLKQFARLAANYGDSRVATHEQRALLLREWQEAFGDHSPSHLHDAVSAAMKTSEFWPTIAKIVAEVNAIRRDTLQAIEHLTHRVPREPQQPEFERDGRNEAEEIIYRASQVLQWKQQARKVRPVVEPDDLDAKQQPKPASQEQTVGYELLTSCAARRARGEATCRYDCSSRDCNIKSVERYQQQKGH